MSSPSPSTCRFSATWRVTGHCFNFTLLHLSHLMSLPSPGGDKTLFCRWAVVTPGKDNINRHVWNQSNSPSNRSSDLLWLRGKQLHPMHTLYLHYHSACHPVGYELLAWTLHCFFYISCFSSKGYTTATKVIVVEVA